MPGTFPSLRTGAVVQEPFERRIAFAARHVTFLNNAQQSYVDRDAALRRWVVDLAQLDDNEIAKLRQFFEDNQGRKGNFTFTDPYDSVLFSNCSFLEDTFPQIQGDEALNDLTLTIYEHPA